MILPALVVIAQAGLSGSGSSLPHPVLASKSGAKQAVTACGLAADVVQVRDEPELQEDVVSIGVLQEPPSPSLLACIAEASLRTAHYVFFATPSVQQQYDRIYSAKERLFGQAQARAWLEQRGLLASAPQPTSSDTAKTYAARVEAFCHIPAGKLLVARDDHFITFAPNGLGHITRHGIEGAAATDDQFECVLNTTSAADVESHGLFVGFTGNAAAAP